MSILGPLTLRCLLRSRPITRSLIPRNPYSQSGPPEPPLRVTSNRTSAGERLYKHETKPSDFDKKILIWAKRYKKPEDIPEYVSWETISAARSNLRVKICMAMIAGTLIACVFMVRSGKQALKEDRTLLQMNIEKKAKWKQEAEREKEQSAA